MGLGINTRNQTTGISRLWGRGKRALRVGSASSRLLLLLLLLLVAGSVTAPPS